MVDSNLVSLRKGLSQGLWLTQSQWEIMNKEVIQQAPEEACGLLAGKNGHVLEVFPTTNIIHSPVRYRMAPQEQYQVFQQMEKQGWDLLGIYHSHPHGPSIPSPIDIKEAYYPEAVYLIWFPKGGEWTCSGYVIYDDQVEQIPIRLEN